MALIFLRTNKFPSSRGIHEWGLWRWFRAASCIFHRLIPSPEVSGGVKISGLHAPACGLLVANTSAGQTARHRAVTRNNFYSSNGMSNSWRYNHRKLGNFRARHALFSIPTPGEDFPGCESHGFPRWVNSLFRWCYMKFRTKRAAAAFRGESFAKAICIKQSIKQDWWSS